MDLEERMNEQEISEKIAHYKKSCGTIREEVAKIYGPTARVFLKKKQVLNQHGAPARGKGKTPSRLILQASADLAQQQASKAIRTRNTVTTAEARA
mgnify:CR=1 FL=1